MTSESRQSEPDVQVTEVVKALKSRGDKPRQQPDGSWRARCPVHGGNSDTSLSVREEHGRLLTHCHTQGCRHQDVMSALDLYRPNHRRESTTTEYDYLNADGSVRVTIMREDRPVGKRIYRKPTGIKKPSHGYPLFGLPSLITAPERPLLVVEGEKTAEHAHHLFGNRYATTTAIGGAGKAHQTDWSPAKGRDVVIWPDADHPGRNHAEHVADHCNKAGAKSVRVVDTEKLPDGWDLADAPPDGLDIEVALADADTSVLRTSLPYGNTEYGHEILSIGELMDREERDADWSVDGLIPRGGVVLITAKPKVGKSTLARALGLAVAKGTPFLGRETCPAPVLYVCLEDRWQHARRHLLAIGAGRDDALFASFGTRPDKPATWLLEAISHHRFGMAIIDPLFRFLPGITDANSYAEISNATDPIISIARRSGCTLVLTHHARKSAGLDGDEALGSTAIAGTPDTIISISRGGEHRQLSTTQREGENMLATRLDMDPHSQRLALGQSLHEKYLLDLEEEIMAAIPQSGDPVTRDYILKAVLRNRTETVQSLNKLVEEGAVVRDGTGKTGSPFQYRHPNSATTSNTEVTN